MIRQGSQIQIDEVLHVCLSAAERHAITRYARNDFPMSKPMDPDSRTPGASRLFCPSMRDTGISGRHEIGVPQHVDLGCDGLECGHRRNP